MTDTSRGERASGLTAALVVPVITVLTVAAYLAWLGWHQLEPRRPGRRGDDYELWQVVGLAVTLVAFVALATLGRKPVAAVMAVTVALTIVWSADASTVETVDASFWPIGAAFLFAGAGIGLGVVAAVTALTRAVVTRISRRRPTSRTPHR